MQCNNFEARRRLLARDGQEEEDLHRDWEEQEIPFLLEDRPWERATVIVAGRPTARARSEYRSSNRSAGVSTRGDQLTCHLRPPLLHVFERLTLLADLHQAGPMLVSESSPGYSQAQPPMPFGTKATSPVGVVTSRMTTPFSFRSLPK